MSLVGRIEEIWTNPEEKAKWFRRLWLVSLAYLAFGYFMIVWILAEQGKLPF